MFDGQNKWSRPNDVSLLSVLKEKLSNCFFIFDEVDDISDPFTCELNYPSSTSRRGVQLLDYRLNLL